MSIKECTPEIGQTLLDNALSKYGNPPARNNAVLFNFKGCRDVVLLLDRKPTKISGPMREGVAVSANKTIYIAHGTNWEDIADHFWAGD